MRPSIVLTLGSAILALVFLPTLVYAVAGNLYYEANASNATNSTINHTHLNSTNSSTDHTHLNATTNSSNLEKHAHADINLSAAFFINSDTEKIKVNIEDFGENNPLTALPHGLPIRFFKINAQNIFFESITVNVAYCEMELKGVDEGNLAVFRYESSNSTWIMLPTEVNKEDNTLRVSVDSLSLFAVSSHSENTTAHSRNDTSQMDDSISHNCTEMEDGTLSASFITTGNGEITLEVESENSSSSSLPGNPIKFFRIGAGNLSYNKVDMEIIYSDAVLNRANESNLSIIHYTNSTWVILPTEVFEDENTLKASVESLSLFAISSFSGMSTGSMGMGVISNCLRCHGTSSTAFDGEMMKGSVPKINQNIMSQSIHAGLNNASSDLNRACWACHAGSTDIPKKHPGHNPVLTCDACHVKGIDKFNSPRTAEHTLPATNISVNATCQLCHGKPQMLNLNGSTLNSSISHYGKTRTDMLDLNSANTDCSYCHQNPASEFSDVFSKTSRTNITHSGGLGCSSCHGTGRIHDPTLVNMQGFSLSNCIQCHGTGGFALNKVNESSINQSIHANLNNASSDLNRACWACHSNIVTSPEKHPDITKLPRSCSKCHIEGALNSINKQKGIEAVHISSHSPESQKIRAPPCTLCHSNNAIDSGKTLNSTVSHYSRYPKVDTRDCVSCHQNKEIGKKWGNPPDPRETIRLSYVEKKLVSDDIWRINQNYSIAIGEVDKEGQSAWLELYYNGALIQKELVPEGGSFKYDTGVVQGGDKKTIIDLRIDGIFYGGTVSLIAFNGFVPEHIHTETNSVQCYACHVKEYRSDRPDGQRYFVLKKDDQNATLNPLDIDFTSSERKTLYSSNSWDLGSGYKLSIKDFSLDREYVWLVLTQNDIPVKEDLVRKGEYFTYDTTLNGVDITMFRLKVANLFVKG
ncbi:MAG: S-layer protein domain-containing protein [Candidatus Methanoperedens sp.]|nr:S-layer protein domain-containing protein [Candidatus Methanoperedens sp.]